MSSKFRRIRSTPIEIASTSEKLFECLVSRGRKSPLNAFEASFRARDDIHATADERMRVRSFYGIRPSSTILSKSSRSDVLVP
jgi:hypothetical protein